MTFLICGFVLLRVLSIEQYIQLLVLYLVTATTMQYLDSRFIHLAKQKLINSIDKLIELLPFAVLLIYYSPFIYLIVTELGNSNPVALSMLYLVRITVLIILLEVKFKLYDNFRLIMFILSMKLLRLPILIFSSIVILAITLFTSFFYYDELLALHTVLSSTAPNDFWGALGSPRPQGPNSFNVPNQPNVPNIPGAENTLDKYEVIRKLEGQKMINAEYKETGNKVKSVYYRIDNNCLHSLYYLYDNELSWLGRTLRYNHYNNDLYSSVNREMIFRKAHPDWMYPAGKVYSTDLVIQHFERNADITRSLDR